MTFSPTKARALASTLAATGPHSYYPTDAECVEAGELLEKACEEIERLRPVYAAAMEWRARFKSLSKRLPPYVHKLREAVDSAIRQAASGEGK